MSELIQTRADGSANSQVTDKAKDRITSWLESYGVDVDHVLMHHYKEGDFVAVRSLSRASGPEAFNEAFHDAVNGYWRNREIDDNCFWIHREWIDALD